MYAVDLVAIWITWLLLQRRTVGDANLRWADVDKLHDGVRKPTGVLPGGHQIAHASK